MFLLIIPFIDNLEEASLRASEGLNQSTESLNFVQVTGWYLIIY